jgi:type IX secretion system PorP/SprF family membrane protein
MKKIFFFLLIFVGAMRLNAQQDHQYTQFMYNKLSINPAYAGTRGVPTLTGIFRSQWLGFEGAPQSFLLGVHSPFLSQRVGVGVNMSSHKIGLNRNFTGSLAYSYDLIARKAVSFRVGLSGSVRSQAIAFNEAKPGATGDPSFDLNKTNEILGNVGAGLYATFSEKVYVGLSVPRLYTNRVGFNPGVAQVAEEALHYYAMAGLILPIGEDINLMPAVLAKYVKNAPFDADINLNLDVRQKFTAGISYRMGGDGSGDSVDLLAFWQASPQLGIGAAYDFPLSNLKNYTAGSVEVVLQADLKKRKKGMTNPRFFM